MRRHSELSDSKYMEALSRWRAKHGDVFEEADKAFESRKEYIYDELEAWL